MRSSPLRMSRPRGVTHPPVAPPEPPGGRTWAADRRVIDMEYSSAGVLLEAQSFTVGSPAAFHAVMPPSTLVDVLVPLPLQERRGDRRPVARCRRPPPPAGPSAPRRYRSFSMPPWMCSAPSMCPPSHSASVRTSSTNGRSPAPAQPGGQFLHRDRLQPASSEAVVLPRVHAALHVALHVVEADADQVRDDLRHVGRVVGHDQRSGLSYGSTQPAQVGRFWPSGMLIEPGTWAAANASLGRTSTTRQCSQSRS